MPIGRRSSSGRMSEPLRAVSHCGAVRQLAAAADHSLFAEIVGRAVRLAAIRFSSAN